jgi:hypothetical protein
VENLLDKGIKYCEINHEFKFTAGEMGFLASPLSSELFWAPLFIVYLGNRALS